MTATVATLGFRERPILFSAAMVRAILDGRKTQTRRLVKLPDDAGNIFVDPGGTVFGPGPYLKVYKRDPGHDAPMHPRLYCPYGYSSDRLWCKETWGLHAHGDETDWFRGSVRGVPEGALRAQYNLALRSDWGPLQEGCFWRPAIFMPRWASRITLEVTEVRVQRLQEISEADARAEGCRGVRGAVGQMIPGPPLTARQDFACLWDSINGKRRRKAWDDTTEEWRAVIDESDRWEANPWIWAITFQRLPLPPASPRPRATISISACSGSVRSRSRSATRPS